jgi:hypothetical protein
LERMYWQEVDRRAAQRLEDARGQAEASGDFASVWIQSGTHVRAMCESGVMVWITYYIDGDDPAWRTAPVYYGPWQPGR